MSFAAPSVLRRLIVLTGAFAALAAACAGGAPRDPCIQPDPCPAEPPLTADEVSACRDTLAQCPGYRAYLDCMTANTRCASNGTDDAVATTNAIDSNCAAQYAAVQTCPAIGVCGGDGEVCCRGATACPSGCCDPFSDTCVWVGDTCSAGAEACVKEGSCKPCGGVGQPCCGMLQSCTGTACCDGTQCVASGTSCTADGSVVCMPSQSCLPCGGENEPCCPGSTCPYSTPTDPLFCSTDGCLPCGNQGQPCCPGNTCTASGGACDTSQSPAVCVCGRSGQKCCQGAPTPCFPGVCTAGMCP